jgi:biopolymer transport protein ExbB
MNEYGLAHVWAQGDIVTRLTAILMLLMSLTSWSIMVAKLWQQRQMRKLAAEAKRFWHCRSIDEGLDVLTPTASLNPWRSLVLQGRDAALHHARSRHELQGTINLSDWLTSCLRATLEDIANHRQRGLPVLASIGSTAPFIGLFGTVWGIYHALIAISAAGAASIDKVAGPVGESLIMTALGLFVAIPAVLAYNAFVRSNRVAMSQLNRFAQDLHACLLTGSRVGGERSGPTLTLAKGA